jgi:hypothetical protein
MSQEQFNQTDSAVTPSTPNPQQSWTEAQKASASQILKACEAAVTSLDFIRDVKLVTKAIKALEIPDAEARFRSQFRTVAIRNLLSNAKKDDNGNVPYPSDAVIDTEVSRLFTNWRAKQAKA